MTGVGPEGQLARRPTAGARPDLTLGDETAIEQVLHASGDDRPAEAGPRDELGARPRAPEADLVEDRDEVVEDLVGERCRAVDAIGSGWSVMTRCYTAPGPPSTDFCT